MKKLFILLSMALCMGAVTSCGNDDDESTGGGGSAIQGPLPAKAFNGMYVKSVSGSYRSSFDLTYSNGCVMSLDEYIYKDQSYIKTDGNGTEKYYDIRTNNDGFITFMRCSSTETSYSGTGTFDETYTFNYSGRQLIAITNDWERHEGGKIEKGSDSWKLEWTNGNLTKIQEHFDDEDDTYTLTYDGELNPWTMKYEAIVNQYKQYPACLFGSDNLEFISHLNVLFCAGLLGDGPTNLPNNLKGWNGTDSFNYTFNTDGTIKSARYGYTTLTYTYTTAN